MTKIAHATHDEHNKIRNGQAGDQTGQEVLIRGWYNRPWNCVLHWLDPIMAERCAYAMERACLNDKIGYDQNRRNTALTEARKVGYDPGLIITPCETDCSALVTIACIYAGIPESALYKNGNSATTSTLRARLFATGKIEIRTADRYTKSADNNVRGDILLYEGHHVAVQIEDGNRISYRCIPDVSHWHPVEDWNLVKGTCPVIISKATQGTTYVDPTLDDFIEQCEKRGIPYWLYAYLNKGKELTQTKYLVNTCKGKVGNYFVGYVLDVEAGNAAENVQKALTWLSKRYRAMLYTGYAEYTIYKEVIAGRGKALWWEARYGKNDGWYSASYPCHPGVDLHQYTSKGDCPGVQGCADLNRVVGCTLADLTTHPVDSVPTGKTYSGTFPVFAPGRDCYKYGDGITTLTKYPTQIKRLQMLVNWINTGETKYSKTLSGSIAVDGKYGKATEQAVKAAQKKMGATVDGIWGTQSMRLARNYRR